MHWEESKARLVVAQERSQFFQLEQGFQVRGVPLRVYMLYNCFCVILHEYDASA